MKKTRGLALMLLTIGLVLTEAGFVPGQAGRRPGQRSGDDGATVVNVVAAREKGAEPISSQNLALYENSIEQQIKGFQLDPSPARIVLLVDNSQTVRADVEKLANAVREFSYEIYEGDQLYVAAYDEKPEIIQEWTDSAKAVEKSLTTFRKTGNPYLFDGLNAMLNEVITPLGIGARKTAIVIIGDGLDRGSKTNFDNVLAALQTANVAVYALQIPDRTGGAYRRDSPKPEQVIQKLTEGTGGAAFDFENSREAAKAVCDELRKNRYTLSYTPSTASYLDERRIFIAPDNGIVVRTKTVHPPRAN